MAKIDYIIQAQRFELVLDKICYILADEISNQGVLTSDNLLTDVQIWKERFIAFDKSELPAINVYFENSDTLENTPITTKQTAKFKIEIIVNSKHSATERADTSASIKCHKLIGIIRYILKNPNYLRLDFDISENFIFNTNISGIQMSQPLEKDGFHIISASLDFEVTFEEYNGEIQPVAGEIYDTVIKIAETEKGFKITKIN